MPSVYKRKLNSGKLSPHWYFSYRDANGKRVVKKGYTDKSATIRLATMREETARKERDGIVARGEAERKDALSAPVGELIERYRDHLERKGDTAKHINHTVNAIRRVLDSAGCLSVASSDGEAIQKALGALRKARSARTANHARGALRGFFRWLVAVEILPSVPSWIASSPTWNERVDRRRKRRALSGEEASKLLEATREAPEIVTRRSGRGGLPVGRMAGEDRYIAYLIALESGLRANEIATLTPESFHLRGKNPHIVVDAAFSKHRREDRQPIPRRVADILGPWLRTKTKGKPCLPLPEKTGQMLASDLRRAGVAVETRDGVVDFHSLRVTYITNLSRRGVSPHVAKELARHSTINLTIDTYTRVDKEELRRAIDGE